eukprot:TRINITY_DN3810_c0_g1_i1.p1 TRINITY_DN3810_c0_g1~~TRINITY_DN3810_c0_g1_i1.p1  ORF type:complete len:197 (+),score=25.79 TRINITY_DN3810_c0_g1_i1:13-603(+)
MAKRKREEGEDEVQLDQEHKRQKKEDGEDNHNVELNEPLVVLHQQELYRLEFDFTYPEYKKVKISVTTPMFVLSSEHQALAEVFKWKNTRLNFLLINFFTLTSNFTVISYLDNVSIHQNNNQPTKLPKNQNHPLYSPVTLSLHAESESPSPFLVHVLPATPTPVIPLPPPPPPTSSSLLFPIPSPSSPPSPLFYFS